MGTLSERILFGQYIIKKGYTTYETLNKAIAIQEELRDGTRLGEILLREFNVFENKEELDLVAEEFIAMKSSTFVEKTKLVEQQLAKGVIEDVEYFINRYSISLNVRDLERAISILESEINFRNAKQ